MYKVHKISRFKTIVLFLNEKIIIKYCFTTEYQTHSVLFVDQIYSYIGCNNIFFVITHLAKLTKFLRRIMKNLNLYSRFLLKRFNFHKLFVLICFVFAN